MSTTNSINEPAFGITKGELFRKIVKEKNTFHKEIKQLINSVSEPNSDLFYFVTWPRTVKVLMIFIDV